MIITKRLKKAVTSMAGTWMSIVEGFGGMRVKNDTLNFSPKFKTMEGIPLKSILETRL
jgi:maltose phosphorylase